MVGVLRRNPEFRRIWSAQCVSQMGDWLHRVAVLTLIGQLSGDDQRATLGIGLLFALEIAVRFLPATVLGTLVGPLADRLPRRSLMIGADLARAGLVALLLFVDSPSDLWLLYGVLFLQMAVSLVFEAARTASVPNTLRAEDLHLGNALSAITWSTMLSIGGLLGAFATQWVGVDGVFLLDVGTYLISALLLLRLRLPAAPVHAEKMHWRGVMGFRDLRAAYAHARMVGALPAIFAKASWGSAGGFLVLLSLSAFEEGDGEEAAVARAMGIAYAFRGLGTAIGPFVGRRLMGSHDRALRIQIGSGYVLGALGYALFALSGGYGWGLVFVVMAHCGGSALWVGSTTLWQRRVADSYRGRTNTLEMTGMMICASVGALLTGLTFDLTQSFLYAALMTSLLVVIGGTLWWRSSHALIAGPESGLLDGHAPEVLAPEAAVVGEAPRRRA